MQIDVFAQELFSHLSYKPWLFDFQRLGAQKQSEWENKNASHISNGEWSVTMNSVQEA